MSSAEGGETLPPPLPRESPPRPRSRAGKASLEGLRLENRALREHLKKLQEAAADYRRRVDTCFRSAKERDTSLNDRRAAEEHRKALLDGERVHSDAQLQITEAQRRSAARRVEQLQHELEQATKDLGDELARGAVAGAEADRVQVRVLLAEEGLEAARQKGDEAQESVRVAREERNAAERAQREKAAEAESEERQAAKLAEAVAACRRAYARSQRKVDAIVRKQTATASNARRMRRGAGRAGLGQAA
eukprot:Hpha_TRINITY_DN16445_c0_g1::TRINITY_DN16445_c0_g1_i1::g.159013::m.159013